MLPIVYNIDNRYGYGDNIVGLVSTYLISYKLNRPFQINISFKNCPKIFENLNWCTLNKIKKNKDKVCIQTHINPESDNKVEEYLKSIPERTDLIISNQAWQKKVYDEDNYIKLIKDTRDLYRLIYTNLLKVNDKFIKDSLKYTDYFKNGAIGIQIRCGDYSWGEDNEYIKPEHFEKVINTLIKWFYKNGKYENVYLTSDNAEFISLSKQKLKTYGIKVFNLLPRPTHFARSNTKENYSIIMDHYLLSQCRQYVICKDTSNYGLTAALISGSDNIWNFDCKKNSIKRNKLEKWTDFIKN
jgi:hypothetical protein